MSTKIEHLTYIYSPGMAFEQYVLKDANFEIPNGQLMGLIGHTGSGKSTLIQHLNGLIRQTEGTITYSGTGIYSEGYSLKEPRSKVGLAFQYPEHRPSEMDAFPDVCFGPKNQGLSKEEAQERAREALQLVGLEEKFWEQSPFEPSGGQKRRVATAGVLAIKPEVLILDEPTAGLDPRGRDEILDQISELHREKHITVILMSYSMKDIARYADRIMVMNHGEKVFDGIPEEVFEHCRELEAMGLATSQVTYTVHGLKEHRVPIEDDITMVEEAARAIPKLFERQGI